MRQFSPRQLVHGLVALSLAMCSQGTTLEQSDKTPTPTQASTTPGGNATVSAMMPQPRSTDYGDGWPPVNWRGVMIDEDRK